MISYQSTTVIPVFKGHSDEVAPCDQGRFSQDSVVSAPFEVTCDESTGTLFLEDGFHCIHYKSPTIIQYKLGSLSGFPEGLDLQTPGFFQRHIVIIP